ncbi:MAG: pilus assembly protein TadG-related protein, partial [Planctomycetota bacterium]|nr:pilus assembly protein TadG-related protein [Planctomycetota bacterium]
MRENDSTGGFGPPRRDPARTGFDVVVRGHEQPVSNNRGARPRARRGLGIIWIIVFLLLLAAFLAGGIDYAWLVEHKSRAQTAAEAAGLAGAQDLGIGRDAAVGSASAPARLNPGTLGEVVVVGNPEGVGGDVRF